MKEGLLLNADGGELVDKSIRMLTDRGFGIAQPLSRRPTYSNDFYEIYSEGEKVGTIDFSDGRTLYLDCGNSHKCQILDNIFHEVIRGIPSPTNEIVYSKF